MFVKMVKLAVKFAILQHIYGIWHDRKNKARFCQHIAAQHQEMAKKHVKAIMNNISRSSVVFFIIQLLIGLLVVVVVVGCGSTPDFLLPRRKWTFWTTKLLALIIRILQGEKCWLGGLQSPQSPLEKMKKTSKSNLTWECLCQN